MSERLSARAAVFSAVFAGVAALCSSVQSFYVVKQRDDFADSYRFTETARQCSEFAKGIIRVVGGARDVRLMLDQLDQNPGLAPRVNDAQRTLVSYTQELSAASIALLFVADTELASTAQSAMLRASEFAKRVSDPQNDFEGNVDEAQLAALSFLADVSNACQAQLSKLEVA